MKYRPWESEALKIPRSDEATVKLFRSLVPPGPGITTKPMFGNISAFVNGNLFFGLFGNDILLRLTEAEVNQLVESAGAKRFEPMKGRQMRGYVVVPASWKKDPNTLNKWIARSLKLGRSLPPKNPRK
jgi:TfoX/Sxy family transcriptional regulator of competence genes